jgi:hypothetical protein
MKADSSGLSAGRMSDHIHQSARLGQCMTINADWYDFIQAAYPA